MLNNDDRRAIEGLFHRLDDVERNAPPRDPEAERLIADEISRQPAAPYYMAQTILVQQHALEVAERRIRELEDEARRQDRGSDIFGGLFGGGGRQSPQRQERTYDSAGERGRGGPWDRQPSRYDANRGAGGGGFLAGAAQTAMGVAGGVLLGNAIGSMFGGGGEAHASEAPADQPADDNTADSGSDAGSDDFGGFDGGGGDFDMGGDF
ncbi:MAG TPA: DUF2076 domain-containing protein [Devosia sp.]|nr:DUF2076 domain-containing protein [Devosia sp.]